MWLLLAKKEEVDGLFNKGDPTQGKHESGAERKKEVNHPILEVSYRPYVLYAYKKPSQGLF